MKEIGFEMAWIRLGEWIKKRELYHMDQKVDGVKVADFASTAMPTFSMYMGKYEPEKLYQVFFDNGLYMYLRKDDVYQLTYNGESGILSVSRPGGSVTNFYFCERDRPTRGRPRVKY